jgi:hypothetical protein
LEPDFRNQCPFRRQAFARVHEGHAEAQLGPHRFHLLGVRTEHSDRDDPLWNHQDGAAFDFARARAVDARVYVASKEASATNGAALRVDGGIINFIA